MCFDNKNKIQAYRGQISKKIVEAKNIQTIFSLTLCHYKKHTICISIAFPYLGSCDISSHLYDADRHFPIIINIIFLLTLWLIDANQTRSSMCGYPRNHFCNSSATKSIKSGRKKILYLRTYKFSKKSTKAILRCSLLTIPG